MLPVVVTEEVFAVVLASASPDVVPLMLVEVFAAGLANAGSDVVSLILLVVETGGVVCEADSPARIPLR